MCVGVRVGVHLSVCVWACESYDIQNIVSRLTLSHLLLCSGVCLAFLSMDIKPSSNFLLLSRITCSYVTLR